MTSNYHHFSRSNIESTKNMYIFTNSYLFKNDKKISFELLKKVWSFFITSCKKIHSKIHSHEKVILREKDM